MRSTRTLASVGRFCIAGGFLIARVSGQLELPKTPQTAMFDAVHFGGTLPDGKSNLQSSIQPGRLDRRWVRPCMVSIRRIEPCTNYCVVSGVLSEARRSALSKTMP